MCCGVKEMYTFEDNSGKSVTLRPEGTAGKRCSAWSDASRRLCLTLEHWHVWRLGIIRALVSNNLLFSLPQKLAYHGSMFRYSRSPIRLWDSCTCLLSCFCSHVGIATSGRSAVATASSSSLVREAALNPWIQRRVLMTVVVTHRRGVVQSSGVEFVGSSGPSVDTEVG